MMRIRYLKKKSYILLFVTFLLSISIGYAYLNSTLNISGTSIISKNTWNVYFENIKIVDGSVAATVEPTIESSNVISKFTFVLNNPGDYYAFTVDIVNKGTIDAMIDSIEKTPELTDEQKKYLNYIIEYENGEQITEKQLIEKDDVVRIKVRVEFKNGISAIDLPQTVQVLNLGFVVNYVQADGNASVVRDNGLLIKPMTNDDINKIGTIVTIGTEQFYTIGTEGENVKLLSMMNIVLEDNPKQSSTAGLTHFSSDEQKGVDYNDYKGSIVEAYVNKYKIEIDKLGVPVIEARIIKKEELVSEEIGCSTSEYSCSKAPTFIYSTTYWVDGGMGTKSVWRVSLGGHFGLYSYNYVKPAGIRPVIVIPKIYI